MPIRSYVPAIAAALFTTVALAQAAAPEIVPVQALNDGLVQTMKAGKRAGFTGRQAVIGPVIQNSFDVPLMTRLSVGSEWMSLSAPDQQALVGAFGRMMAAEYARNFDDWSGEAFSVDPKVEARGGDRLVRTTLTHAGESPTPIAYRLRQSGGKWKIIDVYYRNAISQLAVRRSDFSRILSTGGAKSLIAHLDKLATKSSS